MDRQENIFDCNSELWESIRVANEYRNQYISELASSLAKTLRSKLELTMSLLCVRH